MLKIVRGFWSQIRTPAQSIQPNVELLQSPLGIYSMFISCTVLKLILADEFKTIGSGSDAQSLDDRRERELENASRDAANEVKVMKFSGTNYFHPCLE